MNEFHLLFMPLCLLSIFIMLRIDFDAEIVVCGLANTQVKKENSFNLCHQVNINIANKNVSS